MKKDFYCDLCYQTNVLIFCGLKIHFMKENTDASLKKLLTKDVWFYLIVPNCIPAKKQAERRRWHYW